MNRLIGLNLTTPDGVGLANQRQGKAEGIYTAIDRLFQLAKEVDNDEPETIENS